MTPETPETIDARFRERGFVPTPATCATLFLAERLARPLLIEGPPGVGKTEIAKLWAEVHDAELIRLQCYEGLDESRALYEWSYGKQLLYAQLLREKTSDLLRGADDFKSAVGRLERHADAFFSREFLVPRPLLAAITAENAVLLVDEVDRADEEFEAFLLEVLAEGQVTIPELGTIRAARPPRVILTSNDTRELSDALRRRCLYLHVDYPGEEDERQIVESRVPDLPQALRDQLVVFVQRLRKAALSRHPGIAETLDWALALVAVGAESLDTRTLRKTLGALIKNRDDLERVLADLPRYRS